MFEFRKEVEVFPEKGVEEQLPPHRVFFLILRIVVCVLAVILLAASLFILVGGQYSIAFPAALIAYAVLSIPAIFLLTHRHVAPSLCEFQSGSPTIAVYAYRFDDEKLITNYLLGERLIDISKIKYDFIRSVIQNEVGYNIITGDGKTYFIEYDSIVHGNSYELDHFLAEKLQDRFHPLA